MDNRFAVLYIDDEPINLELFEINFEHKYRIISCLSGHEGLEKLKQHPEINVVISDLKMPVMDGLEFVKQAKKEFPDKIYFLLTGYDISKEIIEALKDKTISKYLFKPFDLALIEKSVDEALSIKH